MLEEPSKHEELVDIAPLNDAALFDIEELEQRLEMASTVDALCVGNACLANGCAGNVNSW